MNKYDMALASQQYTHCTCDNIVIPRRQERVSRRHRQAYHGNNAKISNITSLGSHAKIDNG
jgi:hypothetical protein